MSEDEKYEELQQGQMIYDVGVRLTWRKKRGNGYTNMYFGTEDRPFQFVTRAKSLDHINRNPEMIAKIMSFVIVIFLLVWLGYILRVKAIKRQQRRLAFLVERRTKTITKQKNQIEQQNRKIEKEKEKADQLLLNILPSETADELKNKGVARTRQYRRVTVMFTDIKDFSKVA